VQLEPAGGKKSGFGLGLAIVKRAIEWHDGEVCVAESPFGGARLLATWPVATLAGTGSTRKDSALVSQIN